MAVRDVLAGTTSGNSELALAYLADQSAPDTSALAAALAKRGRGQPILPPPSLLPPIF